MRSVEGDPRAAEHSGVLAGDVARGHQDPAVPVQVAQEVDQDDRGVGAKLSLLRRCQRLLERVVCIPDNALLLVEDATCGGEGGQRQGHDVHGVEGTLGQRA